MDTKIKIGDIFFVVILVIIIALSALPLFFANSQSESSTVCIEIDGEKYSEMPLNVDNKVYIENIGVVIIENMQVRIEDSQCKDKLCERMGNISRSYQSIICLPNKVIIRIANGTNEFDDVAG